MRPPMPSADWQNAVFAMVSGGFAYSVPVERIRHRRSRTFVQTTVSGIALEATLPRREAPKHKVGDVIRVFLASTFWPATLAAGLRDVEKGILVTPRTHEFSAKGRVVRVVGDYAILDCGVYILCELVPAFFIREEQEVIRRNLKAGDPVIESGGLSLHLAEEAILANPRGPLR